MVAWPHINCDRKPSILPPFTEYEGAGSFGSQCRATGRPSILAKRVGILSRFGFYGNWGAHAWCGRKGWNDFLARGWFSITFMYPISLEHSIEKEGFCEIVALCAPEITYLLWVLNFFGWRGGRVSEGCDKAVSKAWCPDMLAFLLRSNQCVHKLVLKISGIYQWKTWYAKKIYSIRCMCTFIAFIVQLKNLNHLHYRTHCHINQPSPPCIPEVLWSTHYIYPSTVVYAKNMDRLLECDTMNRPN